VVSALDIFSVERHIDCGTIGYLGDGSIRKPHSKVSFLPNLLPMKTHCQPMMWGYHYINSLFQKPLRFRRHGPARFQRLLNFSFHSDTE